MAEGLVVKDGNWRDVLLIGGPCCGRRIKRPDVAWKLVRPYAYGLKSHVYSLALWNSKRAVYVSEDCTPLFWSKIQHNHRLVN